MAYNPKIHHRQSIRLKGYDYSSPGFYFVTLCTKNRRAYFKNRSVWRVADECWQELSKHFKGIELDEYVIMPDHVHGIIIIKGGNQFAGLGFDKSGFDESKPCRYIPNNPMTEKKNSLGKIIRYYKARSAYLIRNICRIESFSWQSRYYDRIIWSGSGLERVRNYIRRHRNLINQDLINQDLINQDLINQDLINQIRTAGGNG